VKGSLSSQRVRDVGKCGLKNRTAFFLIKRLTTQTPAKIGFAFSRKTGNAVIRNRFKRRLRALLSKTTGEWLFIPLKNLTSLTNDAWPAEKARIEAVRDNQKPTHPRPAPVL
jgi:ribonuclease P protein component